MPRVLVGVGIGTGFVNTIIQTHHALHEIGERLASATSFGDGVWRVVNLNELEFQGFLVFLFLLVAIWLPIILFLVQPSDRHDSLTIFGIGIFGSALISVMDIRYAFEIIWTQFHEVRSVIQFWRTIDVMNPAIVAGIATYIALVGATWAPVINFIRRKDA